MAFGSTYFAKRGDFSKEEFIKAISKINSATSVTGMMYSNIRFENGMIIGMRESTLRPFTIKVDKLYNAYKDLKEFTTLSLKPYVDRVQSPSLAILIAIGAVK